MPRVAVRHGRGRYTWVTDSELDLLDARRERLMLDEMERAPLERVRTPEAFIAAWHARWAALGPTLDDCLALVAADPMNCRT